MTGGTGMGGTTSVTAMRTMAPVRPPGDRAGLLRGGLRGRDGLVDVRRTLVIPARTRTPHGYPRAQRLVSPYDRGHRLSADRADMLVDAHVLRVGPTGPVRSPPYTDNLRPSASAPGAQRFLLYFRTTTPLSKPRTSSSVNSERANPEPNIGMPEPCTTGYVLMISSSISSISSPATCEPPQR